MKKAGRAIRSSVKSEVWSRRQDSNQWPADYKSAALPTELCRLIFFTHMERETGLEPATYSLEGCRSSQLSYSRLRVSFMRRAHELAYYGGQARFYKEIFNDG